MEDAESFDIYYINLFIYLLINVLNKGEGHQLFGFYRIKIN